MRAWFLKYTASLAAEHSLRVYREAVAAREGRPGERSR